MYSVKLIKKGDFTLLNKSLDPYRLIYDFFMKACVFQYVNYREACLLNL